jgi:hypothetical protein
MHIALFGLNAKERNKQKIHTQLFLLKLIKIRLKNGTAVES